MKIPFSMFSMKRGKMNVLSWSQRSLPRVTRHGKVTGGHHRFREREGSGSNFVESTTVQLAQNKVVTVMNSTVVLLGIQSVHFR